MIGLISLIYVKKSVKFLTISDKKIYYHIKTNTNVQFSPNFKKLLVLGTRRLLNNKLSVLLSFKSDKLHGAIQRKFC